MSTWSDVLNKIANKYHILSWGREIENGREYGIIRMSTCYMKPKHLSAIAEAIQEGK